MNPTPAASRKHLLALLVAAFALRVLAALALGSVPLAPGTSTWQWGHEPACIAQALLEGRGYSDPWGHGTGPTAWLTPPYPLFLASAMELGGGVTSAAAWIVVLVQALASAATALAIVRLCELLGHSRAALIAGWTFALYPISIANAAQVVWDTTFVALALSLVFITALRARASSADAARCGLGFGALLFLNPAPMSLGPILMAWLYKRGGVRSALTFAACAVLLCLPWMVRNQLVLGSFSLRPNLGVELRIGNHDEATGRPLPFKYHPSHVESELTQYRELGEAEYCARDFQRAKAWISEHPSEFGALTARRVSLFWVGEPPTSDTRTSAGAGASRDPASWIKFAAFSLAGILGFAALGWLSLAFDVRLLLGASLLVFGTPYYVSHVSERYRFPLDPILVALGVALIVQVWQRRKARP